MNILSKEIVREWGLGGLPETKQVEMVDRIGRLLYQAMLVRTLDLLTEKEETELDTLLDEDSTTPQEVLAFLQEHIENFDAILADEQKKLKDDVLVPVAA